MTTTLPDAVSESIIALLTGIDLYASLHDGNPGKTGASEIVNADYDRVLIATSGDWSAAAADGTSGGRVKDNTTKLDFGTPTTDWGSVGWLGLWTASTGGTFKGGVSLANVQTIWTGNPVYIPIGDLDLVGAGY